MGLQAGGEAALNLFKNRQDTFISKAGIGSILGHFAFVGWVEPTPSFVEFLRLRRTNIHFAVDIAKCEIQQRPISELNPISFYYD